jgi:hypothetical protein
VRGQPLRPRLAYTSYSRDSSIGVHHPWLVLK